MTFPYYVRCTLACAAVALCLAGCDQKQVQEAVTTGLQQAEQTVQRTVETVKQEVNLAGSIELKSNPPLAAKACYARFITVGNGRPSVLQLSSSKEPNLERFPSIFLQAPSKANSLKELVGQTLQAQVYAQQEQNGTVWHSPEGIPAAVTISAVDDKQVTCELRGVGLIGTDNTEQSNVTGKFVGIIQ